MIRKNAAGSAKKTYGEQLREVSNFPNSGETFQAKMAQKKREQGIENQLRGATAMGNIARYGMAKGAIENTKSIRRRTKAKGARASSAAQMWK